MKFALAKEHRDFFNKHQIIEFDGLLSTEQLHDLVTGINATLANHLKIPVSELENQDPQQLFLSGRDLWRSSSILKKISTHRYFGEIASELIFQKPLRLGYDQFLPSPSPLSNKVDIGPYSTYLKRSATIEEVSCLQGILCGLMLCIKGNDSSESDPETSDVFSKKAGNGIFFSNKAVINFENLFKHINQQYLMIIYTAGTSVYVHCDKDPLSFSLRDLGYSFGDKLQDKRNPIVYR